MFLKKGLPLLLSFCMLFSLAGYVHAQKYLPYVQSLTLEDGLSSPNLVCLFQDSKGLIWLGTSYGLNRYDGTQVRSYTKEDDGLCHNYVLSMSEDGKGNLWIMGGDYGRKERYFCILDPLREQFLSIETYTEEAIPFDPNRTQLFANYQGTFMLREETDSSFNFFRVKKKRIKKAFELRKFDLNPNWLEPLSWETFRVEDNSYISNISYLADQETGPQTQQEILYHDEDGEIIQRMGCGQDFRNIFFPTTNEAIFHTCYQNPRNGETGFLKVYKDQRELGTIEGIRSGDSFFFNQGKFSVLKENKRELHLYDSALTRSHVIQLSQSQGPQASNLFADRESNLWYQEGYQIKRLSLRKQYFEPQLSLGPEAKPLSIRGIVSSPSGQVFAGSSQGLSSFSTSDPSQRLLVQEPKAIFGMLNTAEAIWIARGNGSLWEYFPQKKQHNSYTSTEEDHPLLWKPYKAPNGEIWVGAGEGLYKFNRADQVLEPFASYGKFPRLATSSVYAFYTNNQGTWLSTSSGLYLLNLEEEEVLAHYGDTQAAPYFIPGNHIIHSYEDQEGIFWLASKGQGLIRWDPASGRSERLTKGNAGLSHNELYAVYEDEYKNLWLPSARGLMCFNKETYQVTIYMEEDGLPHDEFNTIAHHQDQEGFLYFGTQNGLIRFHPKDFGQRLKHTPLIITSCFKVDWETDSLLHESYQLLNDHSIKIHPNEKELRITMALLDYSKSKGNQYSYKIDGYHKDWVYLKEGEVSIKGLPYGRYELLLRGKASGSNVWVDYHQPITLKILRPIYLQAWFIITSVLLVLGLLFLWQRRYFRKLRKRQEELERIVAERTEEIKQQAEELKSLDQLKSRFFANISHELRTPLSLILGPLSSLLDQMDEWKKEAVMQHLQTMRRNGNNLMQLVEEILDLSKLEAGKLELKEENTSVREFFRYIFYVFEPQFQHKNLEHHLHLDVVPDLHILMDRKKMEKVLNNFLSNAIKYTPQGGEISLSVEEDLDKIIICVSDSGKGIHPEDLPHIFERFYQSRRLDHDIFGGSGIGLALVAELAQLMGGRVYAESILGEGSKFYFECPKKEVAAAHTLVSYEEEELEAAPISMVGQDFTILVVEDHEDMRHFIFQLLQKKYKRVLLAENGQEALTLLEEYGRDIHLIISDIMMPVVDGMSLLKQIKSNSLWFGIPVVMLTALAAERDKLSALTIGVDDYLTKPFSVPELLIRVQNLLYNYHQREVWKKNLDESPQQGEISPEEQLRLSAADKAWLHELEEEVEKSLVEAPMNVERLASFACVSPRQLRRKIKSITGLSPAKFIKEVQLQLARRELEEGIVISISELAYSCGFEHQATFSSVFKTRFGKSPSEYLKSQRTQLE